jgi:hypothetical protein
VEANKESSFIQKAVIKISFYKKKKKKKKINYLFKKFFIIKKRKNTSISCIKLKKIK